MIVLAGEKVQKIIKGVVVQGIVKVKLSEIGRVGISHLPAFAVEIYVEDDEGFTHVDLLTWEPC